MSLSPARANHKVLFVEARPDAHAHIRVAFDSSGGDARPEFVASAEDALDVIRREDIDVVFLNGEQSSVNAGDFFGALLAMNRQVPLVMMVRQTDERSVLHALRTGAQDCVGIDEGSINAYPAVALRTITRSEAALEHSESAQSIIRSQKQWMSIFDAITDLIFVIDSSQTIVKVNNAFSTVIGRHPRHVIGHPIRDVFDLDIPNESYLQQVLRDGMPRTYEKMVGDEIYQVSIFPLQEDDQPLTIHVMKNITEVRKLKDQLYHSDKLASIGLLVSGVAHEINNPLTGTIAYTELLAMTVTDEKIKAELKKILDSAERCKKIVNNLLTFSRQRTPAKSLESVNDIIDRAIDLRSYWLKSHSIEIKREYDPLATIFADTQQIQQVILNILLNAEQAIVDSGQQHGRIRFATKFDKEARRVFIAISDNGPGIPQKIASKIFDPFFTTKPVGIGTGLGLSISHGIIVEHEGIIRCEDVEGWGATFAIELPTGTEALMGAAGGRTLKESEKKA